MGYHSGTLIDGDPVVCGGYNGAFYDVKCFHFERSTKKWKRVYLLENFLIYPKIIFKSDKLKMFSCDL